MIYTRFVVSLEHCFLENLILQGPPMNQWSATKI